MAVKRCLHFGGHTDDLKEKVIKRKWYQMQGRVEVFGVIYGAKR